MAFAFVLTQVLTRYFSISILCTLLLASSMLVDNDIFKVRSAANEILFLRAANCKTSGKMNYLQYYGAKFLNFYGDTAM